jgi:O-antigen/teichoic acid export membrane protein
MPKDGFEHPMEVDQLRHGWLARARRNPQASQFGIMFANNAVERGLTFVSVAAVLRAVGANEGGKFSLMLKVAGVAALFSTLGVQAAAVRLVSGALAVGDEAKANAVLYAFLRIRVVLSVALATVGWIAAPAVARSVLHQPGVTVFVRLAVVSAAVNSIAAFPLHHLQARQRFLRYAVINVVPTAARTGIILTLVVFNGLTAYRACVAWIATSAVSAVVGFLVTPVQFLRNRPGKDRLRRTRRDLTDYGRWLVVAAAANVVFFNADAFFIARYLNLRALGLYAAAFTLAQSMYLVTAAAVAVLLPHVSRQRAVEDLTRYFRRVLLISITTVAILAPLAGLASVFLSFVYGPEYTEAASAFATLFLAALLPLVYETAGLVLFALDRPRLVALENIVQLVVAIPVYIFAIPRIGIVGGGLGTLAGHGAAMVFVLGVTHRLIRRRQLAAGIALGENYEIF